MKKEFRLEDYTEDKGKFAMRCTNIHHLKSFCKFMNSNGLKWCNGENYNHLLTIEFANLRHRTNLVIYFNEGLYGSLDMAVLYGYTILEYFDFSYRYENKDKMKELEDRVSELEKQVRELKGENIEDKELLNGKFICVKEFSSYTTKGKVYEFVDGYSKYDNGDKMPTFKKGVKSLDELNKNMMSKFAPYREELLNGKFVCVESSSIF